MLKIGLVNIHKKSLLDEIDKIEKTSEPKKTKWSRLKSGFQRFFKSADIPLESLADCIPGLGLAVEFKKTVEHIIE
jgi:hypothetical protein